MPRRDNLNAPSLEGAIFSVGVAVIAFGVAKLVGGFDYTPAVFFAALVFVGSALFLVLPWGGAPTKARDPDDVFPVATTAAMASDAEPAVTVADEGSKPAGLAAPRNGQADDLKTLEGIGPALEKLCNELGIWHFDQIAAWGDAETAWMDANLKGFKGRVTRDKWVAQAKLIGSAGMEEFLRRAKTNDY
jgi:predicted flap endonuclease-1-like 5' DNA nuclease